MRFHAPRVRTRAAGVSRSDWRRASRTAILRPPCSLHAARFRVCVHPVRHSPQLLRRYRAGGRRVRGEGGGAEAEADPRDADGAGRRRREGNSGGDEQARGSEAVEWRSSSGSLRVGLRRWWPCDCSSFQRNSQPASRRRAAQQIDNEERKRQANTRTDVKRHGTEDTRDGDAITHGVDGERTKKCDGRIFIDQMIKHIV